MTYLNPSHRLGVSLFFTVRLADPASDILITHVDLLRAAVRKTRAEHPFEIDAWVTLPDHLHCIWKLPPGDSDHAPRWARIMARFIRLLRQDPRHAKPIWQRRYWDHPIAGPREHRHLVRYCWMNPVKHGLVKHPAQWLSSSWHRDRVDQIGEGCGVLPRDANPWPQSLAQAHQRVP